MAAPFDKHPGDHRLRRISLADDRAHLLPAGAGIDHGGSDMGNTPLHFPEERAAEIRPGNLISDRHHQRAVDLFGVNGENVLLVAHQGHGGAGDLFRLGQVFGTGHHPFNLRVVDLGGLGQAEVIFGFQHLAQGVVEPAWGDAAVLHRLHHEAVGLLEIRRHQHHVDAGIYGHHRRFPGPVISHHPAHIHRIGHHHALEAHLLFQHLLDEVGIEGGGAAFHLGEGAVGQV